VAIVREILEALESIAPQRFTFSFDKVGLQVGDLEAPVQRAVVALDRSLGAVRFAAQSGAQMLIAHHPLIFQPVSTVDTRSHVGRTILELASNGIAFAAAHTNWDSAQGGINDVLANIFELTDVRSFGTAAEVARLKIVTFCPASHADAVVDAASEAGAGVIGAYRRCAFQSPGVGAFEPQANARPTLGTVGVRERVEEVRIEMALSKGHAKAVANAVRRAHPYEEPAVDFFVLRDDPEQPAGRIGLLPQPTTLSEFAARVAPKLQTRCWNWGDPDRKIKRVGIVGGAADDEWMNAQRANADVLLTGEVKQHVGVEASESGFALIAGGHYATENPGAMELRNRLAGAVPKVEWLGYEPDVGFSGRPFIL